MISVDPRHEHVKIVAVKEISSSDSVAYWNWFRKEAAQVELTLYDGENEDVDLAFQVLALNV